MVIFMLLPIIALPVFWLLPLRSAIVIYVLSLLASGWMFWLMRTNMKRPAVMGAESLIGKDADVVSRSGTYGSSYQVRVRGELWSADSDEDLQPGETVVIVAVKGNKLIVRRKGSNENSTTL